VKGVLSEKFSQLLPLYEEYRENKESFKEILRSLALRLAAKFQVEVRFAF